MLAGATAGLSRRVFSALGELERTVERPPIALILGSGFEDRPKLIAALARRFSLIGNGGATVARCKDPIALGALLDTLQIAHPESRIAPPADLTGWLRDAAP